MDSLIPRMLTPQSAYDRNTPRLRTVAPDITNSRTGALSCQSPFTPGEARKLCGRSPGLGRRLNQGARKHSPHFECEIVERVRLGDEVYARRKRLVVNH